jgi:hypothetical protein
VQIPCSGFSFEKNRVPLIKAEPGHGVEELRRR